MEELLEMKYRHFSQQREGRVVSERPLDKPDSSKSWRMSGPADDVRRQPDEKQGRQGGNKEHLDDEDDILNEDDEDDS